MINDTKHNSTKKRITSLIIMLAVVFSTITCVFAGNAGASSVTGTDMANHAMKAYNQGWSYVYGGSSPGAVDCSGLIASLGVGGCRSSMMSSSPKTGSISSLPEIPGLGLYMPGHVGVYVGGGMAVDARNESAGVCYDPVSYMGWTNWFYIAGVDYSSSASTISDDDYTPSSSGQTSGGSSSSSSSRSSTVTPTTPTTPTTPVVAPVEESIGYGSTGEAVKVIQTRLGQLGFYRSTDTGVFAEYTLLCLRNFQATAGVDITGVLDSATKEALFSDTAPSYTPPTMSLGAESLEFLQPVQQRLVNLEYLKQDSVTGTFDVATETATKDFQEATGLPVTGSLDAETISVINSESAPMSPKATALDMGATGENVVAVQNKLSQLRFLSDYVTGVYDETTKEAVAQFQTANGHTATGVINRSEKELLNTDKATKSPDYDTLKVGYSGTDVKALQQKLYNLGYYEGDFTGYYDMETSDSVQSFEEDNSMSSTGVASPSVRVAVDASMNAGNTKSSNDATSGLTTNKMENNSVNVALIVVLALVVVLAVAGVILFRFKRDTLKKVFGIISTTIFRI